MGVDEAEKRIKEVTKQLEAVIFFILYSYCPFFMINFANNSPSSMHLGQY